MEPEANRTPEQEARQTIDAQLSAAGWAVQNIANLNLSVAQGVAVHELRSATDDQDTYLEAWQSVDSDDLSSKASAKEEGVPLAVAKKAFGTDPKELIEELNTALIA